MFSAIRTTRANLVSVIVLFTEWLNSFFSGLKIALKQQEDYICAAEQWEGKEQLWV